MNSVNKPKPATKEDIFKLHTTMIEDCEKRESRMTDWERNFIDSISHSIYRYGSLTPKQLDTLNKIWEKVTDAG